jgi:hypothetical protein
MGCVFGYVSCKQFKIKAGKPVPVQEKRVDGRYIWLSFGIYGANGNVQAAEKSPAEIAADFWPDFWRDGCRHEE